MALTRKESNVPEEKERLQKVMAHAGVASRRKSEAIIRQGRVRVNGQVVTEMGVKVDPEQDEITVDGKPLSGQERLTYLMLNKPPGVLSTAQDEFGRPTVLDLVDVPQRVYPVGRLDLDSEGLILLTNDGELTHILTHPSYEHEKEYQVLVRGQPSPDDLRALRQGVELTDGPAAVDKVERGSDDGQATWLRIVIHEGRKRQIRRMCQAIGYPVLRLIRTRIGPLELGDLANGRYRDLTEDEIKQLKRIKSKA